MINSQNKTVVRYVIGTSEIDAEYFTFFCIGLCVFTIILVMPCCRVGHAIKLHEIIILKTESYIALDNWL